jgi:sucrose phosphorylase
MRNITQLTAYADRLGGTLGGLSELLCGPLAGLFGGVHVLPFFTSIDGADAGFDPTDHTRVDAGLGTWADVAALAEHLDVTADLIVNHMSRASPQFQDFLARGETSDHAKMFLTRERVFPGGASADELAQIYRPRPGAPFTPVNFADGTERTMWTTFTGEQIDLDVHDPAVTAYFDAILGRFAAAGVNAVRLDAVGYAVKTAGTSCFMTPETFGFIDQLGSRCRALGLEVLVEIHAHYEAQVAVAGAVDWVYDFALPPLALYALTSGDGKPLKRWLEMRPRNAVTVLDTHDGIGVIDVGPDGAREGLLTPGQIDSLVEGIDIRSRGESKAATGRAASNLDLYQVNCTYYDALGADERRYWLARALQLFVPGVPQIYYVGLLAGSNDMDLLAETGNGRDINRHRYSRAEITAALGRPVVRRLMRLIRFRNTHPAFNGKWSLHETADHVIAMSWQGSGHVIEFCVDLAAGSFELVDRKGAGKVVVTHPDMLEAHVA